MTNMKLKSRAKMWLAKTTIRLSNHSKGWIYLRLRTSTPMKKWGMLQLVLTYKDSKLQTILSRNRFLLTARVLRWFQGLILRRYLKSPISIMCRPLGTSESTNTRIQERFVIWKFWSAITLVALWVSANGTIFMTTSAFTQERGHSSAPTRSSTIASWPSLKKAT